VGMKDLPGMPNLHILKVSAKGGNGLAAQVKTLLINRKSWNIAVRVL
jgi:hypothetical protein